MLWALRYHLRRAQVLAVKVVLVALAATWPGVPGDPPGPRTVVVVDTDGCHWTRHGDPYRLPDGTHHCRRRNP